VKRLRTDDTGATAVEFALVMLPLLLLLMGIIDFGRTYNAQLSLSAAAREGARVMAISNDPAAARTAIQNSALINPGVAASQVSFSPATCSAGATVAVTITYPMTSVTGFFTGMMSGKHLYGRATMKCNG
jgi:Flp pilus assembly protein TadG